MCPGADRWSPEWQRVKERRGLVCARLIRMMRRRPELLQAQILDVFCQDEAGNCSWPIIFDWYRGINGYSFIQKSNFQLWHDGWDQMGAEWVLFGSLIPQHWRLHRALLVLWFGSWFPARTINNPYGSFMLLVSHTAIFSESRPTGV